MTSPLRWLAVAALAAALPAYAVDLKKETERKRAPDFELKNGRGEPVRLSDYAGKVVLLDFWATWCAPCKSAMPWMEQMTSAFRSQGFETIGVSMDEQGWEVVKPFLVKTPVTYPVVLGNKRVAYLYGDVDSLPLAFFIDRQQRVAAIHLGSASRKDFQKTVKLLLEGR